MTDPIRVLIAEDQSLVRGALVALLDTEPDISVVAECATGAEVAGGVHVALSLDFQESVRIAPGPPPRPCST